MCFGFSSNSNSNNYSQTKKTTSTAVSKSRAPNTSNDTTEEIKITIKFKILTQTLFYSPDGTNDNMTSIDLYWSTLFSSEASSLLVIVHGGAWTSEDKKDYEQLCFNFATMGFTCASINYRLSTKEDYEDKPKIQYPTHINDVGHCIKLLYTHPLGVYDPQKIFLIGHSSGAHISMMLLLDSVYSQYIKGVLGVSGIYDIPLLLEKYPDYKDIVEQAFGDVNYKDASPTSKIRSDLGTKRIVLLHGYEDTVIDNSQSLAMYSHLKKFHNDVWFHPDIKGDHYQLMDSEILNKYL